MTPGARAWLQRHGHLVALLGASLLVLWMYLPAFGGVPIGQDNAFHLAESTRIADCIRAHDWDCWNPSGNAGYATAYYYQVVPQAMPAVLSVLTGGHLIFWFDFCVVLPLVLVPWFGYRGLRHLGATPWQAVGGGVAIAFCLSNNRWGHGADGQFSVGLYTQTWAFAVFPLGVGQAVRWLRDGRGLAWAVATSTFIGLCHPFAGVALGIALAAGVLWRPLPVLGRALRRLLDPRLPALTLDRAGWRTELSRLVALGALLLFASLAGWLTVVVDYAGFGGFPHRVADEGGPGLMALSFELVLGHVLDYARPGVLSVLLLPSLLLVAAPYRRWVAAAMVAFFALLCVGPHLVTKDDLFPGVRFWGTFQIACAMIAGAGAVTLAQRLWAWSAEHAHRSLIRYALVSATSSAVVMLTIPTMIYQRHNCAAVETRPELGYSSIVEMTEHLRDLPEGRKQAIDGTDSTFWNLLPYVLGRRDALIQMGGGGLQASPNYVYLWNQRSIARLAQVYDAPYYIVQRDQGAKFPAGTTLATSKYYELRKLPSEGLVSPIDVVGSLPTERAARRKAILDWFASDAALHDQFLSYAPLAQPGPPRHGETLAVKRQASPGDAPDIVAQVRAESATTFVLRESWHPRWHAFIDGAPAPIQHVSPSFSAVEVPAGNHELSFRFDRPWWAHAAWLAWPLGVLLGGLLERLVRRRSQARA